MRAGDLQHMFASFVIGHTELPFGRPALDPCDRGARRKTALDRLSVERDRHLDMAAMVNMDLEPLWAGAVLDEDGFVERLVLIFSIAPTWRSSWARLPL